MTRMSAVRSEDRLLFQSSVTLWFCAQAFTQQHSVHISTWHNSELRNLQLSGQTSIWSPIHMLHQQQAAKPAENKNNNKSSTRTLCHVKSLENYGISENLCLYIFFILCKTCNIYCFLSWIVPLFLGQFTPSSQMTASAQPNTYFLQDASNSCSCCITGLCNRRYLPSSAYKSALMPMNG